jgi:integrase/recombinase XerD
MSLYHAVFHGCKAGRFRNPFDDVHVRKAELNKTGGCHLFRHSMATSMLENGADIRFIQAMLGHASLETTEIYTRVSIQKLRQIHDATHPASKLKPNGDERDRADGRRGAIRG